MDNETLNKEIGKKLTAVLTTIICTSVIQLSFLLTILTYAIHI